MSATVPSSSGSSSHLGSASRNTGIPVLLPPPSAAQFREIHKNTWLKRLSADGKKITVGPKKSERSWVVFCVHDDTEALLEGYAEPRQAASHMPEWIVSLKDTLHISHALIPNLHEFEFVVTLSNEVLRFHSMSWEIMQEWVETLRSKLREMKILSPRENLYTKLPEVRAPLLPTRDPTSPLPAPPPVPAAIVPGVERVTSHQSTQHIENEITRLPTTEIVSSVAESAPPAATPSSPTLTSLSTNSLNQITTATTTTNTTPIVTTTTVANTTAAPNLTSMSNTLTQNLLNMLSDPISTYSEQINETTEPTVSEDDDGGDDLVENGVAKSLAAGSSQDVNLSDDEFLSPLLRKACTFNDSNVLFNVDNGHRTSADQLINLTDLLQFERLIPRPQTSRSMSAGAADKVKKLRQLTSITNNVVKKSANPQISCAVTAAVTPVASLDAVVNSTATATTKPTAAAAVTNTNVTIIQVSTNCTNEQIINNDGSSTDILERASEEQAPPKLPTKTITGEIFRFPEIPIIKSTKPTTKQHEYKSNVQIIPSNVNSSTIQVLGQSNQNHSTPVKCNNNAATTASTNAAINTTMVHVIGSSDAIESSASAPVSVTNSATTTTSVAIYGTCYTPATAAPSITAIQTHRQQTPKLTKKVILTANPSGITNITISNEESLATVIRNGSDDRIDIDEGGGASTSTSANATATSDVKHNVGSVHYEKVFLSSSIPIPVDRSPPNSLRTQVTKNCVTVPQIEQLAPAANNSETRKPQSTANSTQTATQTVANVNGGSPALPPRRVISPNGQQKTSSVGRPMLTRGLTEAVINTRPSRKDFHYMKLLNTPLKSKSNKNQHSNSMVNNNVESNVVGPSSSNATTTATSTSTSTPVHAAVSRTNAELVEQRRRSSSTSDAQMPLLRTPQRGANNNEFPGSRVSAALRMQQPPQPYRGGGGAEASVNTTISNPATTTTTTAQPKRLTLREQQVMQLRREIMHPGGVRLQLRRKDCLGSIAWVDAFGAVWVAGWKQKEHPVLYNALHIGDQLLSIAGVSISNAAEANKIIRNTNTLFLEVLVRRIPFGRAYAIRRDREGQCLGLIRDGNTSTIVDVVPNSLAARHGLPPKAQSCDGTTLTFWMLTEINGRPLNIFFKDNEIRDRLNSVGRDISILVQPSDLITKIKKQLKSLRGYKEYLVQ